MRIYEKVRGLSRCKKSFCRNGTRDKYCDLHKEEIEIEKI